MLKGIRAVTTLSLCLFTAALSATPLPQHPRLVDGALENGLSYVLLPHAHPPGRVSLRLHVPVGSLNENDDESGFAHLIEHLAFGESENFPRGVTAHFEALGLTVGRHQNAFTGLDQTVYLLDLPENTEQSMRDGLTFLADVLGRLEFPDDRIESEREIVLAEYRDSLGPQQRLASQWFPRLTRGTKVAERPVLGDSESLAGATTTSAQAFYERWYTPRTATVVVVGEFSPDEMRALIADAFGDLPGEGDSPVIDPGAVNYESAFGLVATDRDAVAAEVTLLNVTPKREPELDEDDARRDLVEIFASYAFNRRFAERVMQGGVSFRNGGASIGPFYSVGWSVGVSAAGDPADWREIVTDLVGEFQRFRVEGIDERELDEARRTMTASIRQFAQTEQAIPTPLYAQMLTEDVHTGDAIVAAADWLALIERFAPAITVEEVSAVFRDGFDPSRMSVALTTKPGKHAPTEDELLAVAQAAFDAEVAVREADGDPVVLPPPPEAAGQIVGSDGADGDGVESVWLSNGVRVHHREMGVWPGQVVLRITLAGGMIEEDADTRLHTVTSIGMLNRLATRSLTSTDVARLLVGRTLSFSLETEDDYASYTLACELPDLDLAMQFAHLTLTEPLLEPVAFDQWRRIVGDSLRASEREPASHMQRLLQAARYPADDPRWAPIRADELQELELPAVQAWLDAFVARAPLEVTIVGDIARDDAFAAAARWFGSLPARERIGPDAVPHDVAPPTGRLVTDVAIASSTPQASVIVGFPVPDGSADGRALTQAARILGVRLTRRLREQEQLVYSISAHHSVAPLPGYSTFSAGASVSPERAERLAAGIDEVFAEFAQSGPTDDEVAMALRQFENEYGEALHQPYFWIERYARRTYRSISDDTTAEVSAGFRALTAERIREVFARHLRADAGFRVIVRPTAPKPSD